MKLLINLLEMRLNFCACILMFLILLGCAPNKTGYPVFENLSSDQTHVTFVNTIVENDSINILTYEYLFNGGGVGILDVNNDGLQDVFFTGSQVTNALYLNKGNFKFDDISELAGIQLKGEWCTGVSVVDINADGYDDLYVSVGGTGNKSIFPNNLFINQGDLTFKEMAAEYNLADPSESIQSVFFDYDRDGDLDMYLLVGGGFERSAIAARPIFIQGENRNTDRLYRNTYDSLLGHPVFEDVSSEAGILIEGFGLGVSIIDANMDSWPDVLVSNDYLSRDLLYINNQDGTFTDQGLNYFKHTSHFSMGNDVGDVNNDGLPDIITVDMLPENHVRRKQMFGPNDHERFFMAVEQKYGYQYMRNMLQVNHGKDGFSEVAQLAGIERTDWSWGPLLADFDNDGYQDIFITNGFGRDITDLDFVKFRSEASAPFSDRSEREKLFMDSLKHRPAIILPNYIYKNETNLTFSNQTKNWGLNQPSISNGAAYADLDSDGDLDLIVSNLNQEAFIYKNNTVEADSSAANFFKVLLKGSAANPSGLGSTISIYCSGRMQRRYQQVVHGFQSSTERSMHFGLGTITQIDSAVVVWPDGKVSHIENPPMNSTQVFDYQNAALANPSVTVKTHDYFTHLKGMDFFHYEAPYNDFRVQPLLINGFSNQGPGIAVGDVNGDGADDIFIGGAYQSVGTLFLQKANGQFEKRNISAEEFEDLGAVFFDTDNDGDLDLYVVSGGSERYENHVAYQDRLYVNDGTGNFSLDKNALPTMLSSTAAVAAADFDSDGDLDLFVGGRVRPGNYPEAPESYLLENQGGKFVVVTDQWNSSLHNIGMVTTAIWTDFNNDLLPDLVLAGEFMRITFLKNTGERFIDITGHTSLKESYGMWSSLQAADFDNDGDLDFVAGNIGFNTPFTITSEKPMEVHYADFDNNGSIDPIFSSYEEGKAYPLTSLDQLTRQLPMVRKHILYYRQFSRATTSDLLRMVGGKPKTLSCTVSATSFIENLGDEKFSISPLPMAAQIAPVNGIATEDVNSDGMLDFILVGNSYNHEVENGRYDASIGVVLLNKGNNEFHTVDPSQTSFCVKGDARAIARVELSNKESALLVSQNNDYVEVYSINQYDNLNRLHLMENEIKAIVTMTDGTKRLMEFFRGGSYLSQNSRSIVITPSMRRVEVVDSKGKVTRTNSYVQVNNNKQEAYEAR